MKSAAFACRAACQCECQCDIFAVCLCVLERGNLWRKEAKSCTVRVCKMMTIRACYPETQSGHTNKMPLKQKVVNDANDEVDLVDKGLSALEEIPNICKFVRRFARETFR